MEPFLITEEFGQNEANPHPTDIWHDYSFYGYRLRTCLLLRNFPSLSYAADTSADITMRFGDSPSKFENAVVRGPFLQIDHEGNVLLSIAAIGRFWIQGGEEIIVTAASEASTVEIETILTSTVAGIVLHQRRQLPVHASAVVVDGKAIVFAGPPAIGKSTIAAAFVGRGDAEFLSDDLCSMRFIQDGVLVNTGPTGLCLWPDVMQFMDIDREKQIPVRPGHPKCMVPQLPAAATPLGCIVRMHNIRSGNDISIRRVHRIDALMPGKEIVHQHNYAHSLGSAVSTFTALTGLAQKSHMVHMTYPRSLPMLNEVVDSLLQYLEENA